MTSIAIITARGGSKRIPQKNIKEFCGEPIIAYSIKAALEANVFNEVMVSTDSKEIAKIAIDYGASVPFLRTAATSNDYATTADVIEEVLSQYESIQGKSFDFFACIYPTAPFVTAEKLREAIKLLTTKNCDGIIPVVKFSFPPQRGFEIRDGFVKYIYPEHENSRSQDLEPMYHDCGQFYVCKTSKFNEKRTLVLPNTIPIIVKEEEVQDIDTLSDWIIAEAKYKVLNNPK
jgi:N-acylneuraminate cytidylyltransferase